MAEFEMMNTQAQAQETTPAVVAMDGNENFVAELKENKQVCYCSMQAETQAEKVALYNAMNNPSGRLADMINMDIDVKDIFVESVVLTNKETGEVQTCPRIVLICADGASYQCVSIGVFSALKKLLAVFGEPCTWESPIRLHVKQISKGTRNMLTLEVLA